MFGLRLTVFLAGYLLRLCAAQAAGWQEGQANSTMCQWQSPRAAVVRDTLFLDGGYLWWKPGMSDESYGPPTSDGNPLGLVYMLNFSSPFNISQNSSELFTTLSKAAGGGASNNIGPQYYDGAMFANDYEWFTYGGQLKMTDAFKDPAANAIAAYQVYPSGEGKAFNRGFILDTLPDGITRYITNGAAVSVPSENLGFYFAGLRSASFGPISYLPPPKNQSLSPDHLSTTLIQLNMTKQGEEEWKKTNLPTNVPGRASAEIVWIPVSEKGILVAIGGVIFPSYLIVNQTNNASSTAQSEEQSPLFMSTVSVYDIAKETWYEQNTSNAPGQLMQGCTVVASAQDGSSHNIYYYGGYDGLHPTNDFSDSVYVLSIPSFKWTMLNVGKSSHARAGHKCTKPYPDQMLVVGGFKPRSGTDIKCVENFVQIYNLSSNEWLPSYDPNVFSEYTVPSTLISAIGGTAVGGATVTTPSGGFSDPALQAVLAAPYDKLKIKNYYPYKKASPTNNDRPTLSVTPVSKHSDTPAYLGPVIGVVLGLFFLTLAILAYMLWKKRRFLRSSAGTQSEAGTMDNGNLVSRWLHSTPANAKAPTETTEETIYTPHEEEPPPLHVDEIDSAQVYEIGDTSKYELHDTQTGLVPIGNSHRNTRNSSIAASPSSQSYQSNNSQSRWSQSEAPARPSISPLPSPTAGVSPSQSHDNQQRIMSGVSNFSETDRKHLRGISDTSVSTEGGLYPTPNYAQQQHERPSAISPITPPAALESRDYIDAGPARAISPSSPSDSQSAKRRSNFSELLDDNEKR
ncbi:hypothetical protein VTL71DRAFT_6980 [Oculimacula yallundae]|uniref:Attractin/MKLN-like beta-propeller domain-containing protein n=1 Tax=Oculimacula yallundae TaxID=86028 RepID=A0ABR4BVC8_9HELO